MILSKYDIVLVNFPFSDFLHAKLRPALVLMPLPGHNVILCQITTKRRRIGEFEVGIKRADCEGDIRFDSNAYVGLLFTLHGSLIQRKVGHVNSPLVRRTIEEKLATLFTPETGLHRAA